MHEIFKHLSPFYKLYKIHHLLSEKYAMCFLAHAYFSKVCISFVLSTGVRTDASLFTSSSAVPSHGQY